jgi:hypothetical protein
MLAAMKSLVARSAMCHQYPPLACVTGQTIVVDGGANFT